MIHCFSLSSFVVLMLRMASPWVAVHWTLRLAPVLVWYFKPTTLTVSAASLSSTALTRTSTSRPKLCPATHQLPATCEYFKHILSISISHRTAKVFQEEAGKNLLKMMIRSSKDNNKMMSMMSKVTHDNNPNQKYYSINKLFSQELHLTVILITDCYS